MKTVALVPIKLNSERLPNKNLLPLNNKPLCWHILNTLLQVNGIDNVYVYCSDPAITNYIPDMATFLKRNSALDHNYVKGIDIYDAFINEIHADIYVLAHTTSPFIREGTIEHALNKVKNQDYDSAFSAEKVQTFAWYENLPINYTFDNVLRTQDLSPIYIETSGFYIFKREILKQYRRRIGFHPYIQEVSKIEAVDIDEQADYDFALKLAAL